MESKKITPVDQECAFCHGRWPERMEPNHKTDCVYWIEQGLPDGIDRNDLVAGLCEAIEAATLQKITDSNRSFRRGLVIAYLTILRKIAPATRERMEILISERGLL